MKAIVCMNHDMGIGYGNKIPWKSPMDMAHFRRQTIFYRNEVHCTYDMLSVQFIALELKPKKFQKNSRKIPGNSGKLQKVRETSRKFRENSRKISNNSRKFQKNPEILETSWKKILRKTYLIRSLVQAADELCSRFFWVFWNPQKWFQVFSYLLHQFWH